MRGQYNNKLPPQVISFIQFDTVISDSHIILDSSQLEKIIVESSILNLPRTVF